MSRPWPIITHQFGELAEKASQRYLAGTGPRKFAFKRSVLNHTNRTALLNFYESVQGSYQSFIYNAPNGDQTTTAYTVMFDTQPLTVTELVSACQTGIVFVEIPSTNPSYTSASVCTRFPSSTLQTALTSQVQQIIPLVHIQPRELSVSGTTLVDNIYLSDRGCTVDGKQYLPRLLNVGDAGSGAIVSQDIRGTSDNVTFTIGNADRVMGQLANNTDLKNASIDLCLYHINSGIKLHDTSDLQADEIQSMFGD